MNISAQQVTKVKTSEMSQKGNEGDKQTNSTLMEKQKKNSSG